MLLIDVYQSPPGRLLNPLYRRNISIRWIRSQDYFSVKHYSTSLTTRDDSCDEIQRPSTTSDWLFQIPPDSNLPSELGVPLPPIAVFLKDTIDWEAVDKLFKKRPALVKFIRFGRGGYHDRSFLASLANLRICLRHNNLCTFETIREKFNSKNGPGYMYDRSLVHCHLTCDLTKHFSNSSGIDPQPPLKITASATKKVCSNFWDHENSSLTKIPAFSSKCCNFAITSCARKRTTTGCPLIHSLRPTGFTRSTESTQ